MFSVPDSFSYCSSGNPFQLDPSIWASNPSSEVRCRAVVLSGPCRGTAHLHRHFIITTLLRKL